MNFFIGNRKEWEADMSVEFFDYNSILKNLYWDHSLKDKELKKDLRKNLIDAKKEKISNRTIKRNSFKRY